MATDVLITEVEAIINIKSEPNNGIQYNYEFNEHVIVFSSLIKPISYIGNYNNIYYPIPIDATKDGLNVKSNVYPTFY